MTISRRSPKLIKPKKPRPDFPLYAHRTKRWAKKICGRTHYFGPWADPEGALQNFLDQKDDLLGGRVPRSKRQEGLPVQELTDRFLTSKRRLLDARELSPRTYADYYEICKLIVKLFHGERLVVDLRPEDFEKFRDSLSKMDWGPARRGKAVQIVRCIFRYAAVEGLIDKPILFGGAFKRPSAKVMRQQRAKNGKRMFEANELHQILAKAGRPLRAMILLAANTGFGNNDIASLPISALDLEKGWVDFGRPKTGVPRRCPLWLETIEALKEVIAHRPQPKDEKVKNGASAKGEKPRFADLVFLTRFGTPWVKVDFEEIVSKDGKKTVTVKADDAVSKEMTKLLKSLKLKRPGLNFYALRHNFETIGGAAKDQPAVNAIMGHVDSTMAATYREGIDDDRLQAVVDHIHNWLFPELKLQGTGTAG